MGVKQTRSREAPRRQRASDDLLAVFACWPERVRGNSVFKSVTFGSRFSAAFCASPSSRRMCCSAVVAGATMRISQFGLA